MHNIKRWFGTFGKLTAITAIGWTVGWIVFLVQGWLKYQFPGFVRVAQDWADTVESWFKGLMPDAIAVWIEDMRLEIILLTLLVILVLTTLWHLAQAVLRRKRNRTYQPPYDAA